MSMDKSWRRSCFISYHIVIWTDYGVLAEVNYGTDSEVL